MLNYEPIATIHQHARIDEEAWSAVSSFNSTHYKEKSCPDLQLVHLPKPEQLMYIFDSISFKAGG
jgi:hypothetical protein